MRNAGLNIGMMYGGSGTGGATVGSQRGNVNAPDTYGNINPAEGMVLGMQASKNEAEIDLIKAQADLAKAEAAKKRGVDTKEGEARIENLAALTANTEAIESLNRLDYNMRTETYDDAVEMIRNNTDISGQLLRSALANANVDTRTENSRVKTAKNTADNIFVDTMLKRIDTRLASVG